ncbi:unnamed protein product, partial [Linum tenue]
MEMMVSSSRNLRNLRIVTESDVQDGFQQGHLSSQHDEGSTNRIG